MEDGINNSILIPVDFREQSMAAISQAYNLARLNEHDITLLYVHEDTGFWAGLFSASQQDEFIEKAKENLEKLADKVREESGIRVHTRVAKGRVYSEILEVAEEIDAAFIMMGVASVFTEGDKSKRIVGANASRVIRAAKCPVLSVNATEHYKGCRSILVPLDLTKETRQKVKYAVDIARAYKATIKTISVIWDVDDADIRWRMDALVDQVKKFIEEEGLVCHSEIIEIKNSKQVVPEILKYAKEQGDVDLMVIMTQSEVGFVDYFVGSKAQELIRLSDIPVMSVTPKDFGLTYIR